MRLDNRPTEEQLSELYAAAKDFKQAQPWKWMHDLDLICVENPKDKKLGYCSVMGGAGEHFALGVYMGDEGLASLGKLMDVKGPVSHQHILHAQDCLMCSFEDRELLTSEDRKQIKSLGLSFRGKNAWPMFRRYEPGYEPWYLNEEECVFLTHALRQTLFVVANMLTKQVLQQIEHGITIARYSELKNGQLEWHSKEQRINFPTLTVTTVTIDDDMLIQRLKKTGRKSKHLLQVDISYMPSAVQEKRNARPYFPRLIVIADAQSGMIVDFEMFQRMDDDIDITLNKLIHFSLEYGLPQEIQVRSEAMVAILQDLCDKTGIQLKLVKRLACIDEMMRDMVQHFM